MASSPSSSTAYHILFFFSFSFVLIFLLFAISLQQRIHIFYDHHHSINAYQHEEALIMRKFPTLLSPLQAPAPAPSLILHPRPHHRPPHHHLVRRAPIPIPEREVRRNGGVTRAKKIMVASLVSSGFIFILTVLVIIVFVCHYKFNKGRNRNPSSTKHSSADQGTAVIKSNNGPDWLISRTSQNTTRKVTSHDEPDHPFPLETFPKESDEDQLMHLTNQDPILRSDSNTASVAAAEIISIHDDSMDSNDKYYESDAAMSSSSSSSPVDQKLELPHDDLSEELDEDESFHSLCDSRSSSIKLTNLDSASTTFINEELAFQLSPKTPPPAPPPPPPPPPPRLTISSSTQKALSKADFSTSKSPPVLSNSEIKTISSSSAATPPPPCPPPSKGNVDQNQSKSRLPKLKPLHWDKVRAAPHRSTVWDNLRCSSFELDEEMIESLFGYHLKDPTKADEPRGSSPNTNKHVLEAKRLQNITILSKSVNATAHQVCHSLEKGEGLCLQQLEVLAKMTLTKEEEEKLSGYKGDVEELGSAEKFVKTMLNVPFAFQRIESMLYRETFDDEVIHLRKSLSMLQEACQELRSSRLFLKLLEAVLKTGNRMNDGTIRGGAKAFKLDALLKLADVKGTDGKTTLLHFVVQEIMRSEGMRASESIMGKILSSGKKAAAEEEKEEDYKRMGLELVSSLSVELQNVKKTATIDLDVVSSSMRNLFEGMCRVKNLVHERLGGKEEDGSFVQVMRAFVSDADKKIKELRNEESEILLRVREITEYFHGDVVNMKKEANPLRIFVIVRDFLGMLDHVCRELRSSRIPNSSPNPLSPFR
ncbi:formin-like protein 11 [Impatiens glandulifera]|uniref:formin-like protein 11 n=1 Tax=Impatiens glandulifera TaxID=253017 RepID=UPI001FB197FD|nr:formin-like protein 11 [Impatiens glandulifera]